MKVIKITAIFLLAILASAFAASPAAAAASDGKRVKVKIGVSSELAKELWAPVVKRAADDGIDIELITFGDYTIPNEALNAGEIDLNAFQHHTFLNNEIKSKGYKIVSIADTFFTPMSVYSRKIKTIKELKAGDKIAVPNDVVNLGRALTVLQGAKIIKLDPNAGLTPELNDITENPLKIEIVQLSAEQVPALLPDVAAGLINVGHARDFGLSPSKDGIFQDNASLYKDNGYVNLIAARIEDAENEVYKRVVKAYQTDEQKKFFESYGGFYIPAW
ncbi:MAG: MetQ/NlpA family ABC transporter substrate-binding protein [Synergistaceae bacterium]|jgi:D-methionine transport system substrate-binding protein|nr:MetQ/NlpA family ABC transporter substrate-binding protein [Synergistaceae bacterium]